MDDATDAPIRLGETGLQFAAVDGEVRLMIDLWQPRLRQHERVGVVMDATQAEQAFTQLYKAIRAARDEATKADAP